MLLIGLGLQSSCRVALSSTRRGTIELLDDGKCGIYRICIEDGKIVAGYDTCHCFELIYRFTAFMHFILLLVRRHVRAFKFPGLARMLNLYCIFVYSVIDPSGT